jgi:hypothetical protein
VNDIRNLDLSAPLEVSKISDAKHSDQCNYPKLVKEVRQLKAAERKRERKVEIGRERATRVMKT